MLEDDLGRDWGDTDDAMLDEISKSWSVEVIISTTFLSADLTGSGTAAEPLEPSKDRSSP